MIMVNDSSHRGGGGSSSVDVGVTDDHDDHDATNGPN